MASSTGSWPRTARGLQHSPARERRQTQSARSTPRRPRSATPEYYQYDPETSRTSPRCGVGGSVVGNPGSWTSPATERSPSEPDSRAISPGRVSDFRRGAAGTPGRCDRRSGAGPHVLAAALFEALRLAAAKRSSRIGCCRRCAFGFGGHVEKGGRGAGSPPRADALVFFGATGDPRLQEDSSPALYAMASPGPPRGARRRGWRALGLDARAAFRARASHREEASKKHGGGCGRDDLSRRSPARLIYVDGGTTADPTTYRAVHEKLSGASRPLHYPSRFRRACSARVVEGLGTLGQRAGRQGRSREALSAGDLPSAQALNATLHRVFDEASIFRIDHYPREGVSPETFLVFSALRIPFSKPHLEPKLTSPASRSRWRRASESRGRGRFLRGGGSHPPTSSRNHLLQVVGFLLAMEPPLTTVTTSRSATSR